MRRANGELKFKFVSFSFYAALIYLLIWVFVSFYLDTTLNTFFSRVIKDEIQTLQRDIILSKRLPNEKKLKKKKQSLVDEMRNSYTSHSSKIISRKGKKVVLDEDVLIAKLDLFKRNLKVKK